VTEQGWDWSTDPATMLGLLRGRASARKLRLFAVACCRRLQEALQREGIGPDQLERIEWHADGLLTWQDMWDGWGCNPDFQADRLREQARDWESSAWLAKAMAEERPGGRRRGERRRRDAARQRSAWPAAERQAEALWPRVAALRAVAAAAAEPVQAEVAARSAAEAAGSEDGRVGEGAAQCALLRCIFGTPFRPARVEPAWLTWHGGAVVKLAGSVEEERELPSGHLDPARLAVLADMLEESSCADPQLLGHLRGPGPHVRGCFAIDVLTGRS
jgi:hypothetical protein